MSPSRAVVMWALFGAGCASTTQPAAPYRLSEPEPVSCLHPVSVLTAAQASRPAYHEVARLSATCPGIAPTQCERTLLARACDLGADAIIVQRELPIARTKYTSRMAEEAIAVRFAER